MAFPAPLVAVELSLVLVRPCARRVTDALRARLVCVACTENPQHQKMKEKKLT